jgi:hypothetical protein
MGNDPTPMDALHRAERLHRDAMRLAEDADLARLRRSSDSYVFELTVRALVAESAAARVLIAYPTATLVEPSRSVLCRSAASLAVEAAEYVLADAMAADGLAGYPPDDIKLELEEIQRDVRVERDKLKRLLSSVDDLCDLVSAAYRGPKRLANALLVEACVGLDSGDGACLFRCVSERVATEADLVMFGGVEGVEQLSVRALPISEADWEEYFKQFDVADEPERA